MANTLSGNVRFGRGLLSVMPTGNEYSDMLYFATDAGVVFMNGEPVTSGLLDMVYRAVSSSSGELARWAKCLYVLILLRSLQLNFC